MNFLLIVTLCIVGVVYCAPPSPVAVPKAVAAPQTGGAPPPPPPPGMNHDCMSFNLTKNPTECCKLPVLIDSAITMKCDTDFTKPVGPPKGPPKGCCMSECVMNATGILVNGKFDKTIAQKVLTQNVLADAAWVKIINSAIDKCLVDAETKEAEFKVGAAMPAGPGEKICNPMSGFMMGCVTGQVYKNCPTDKYTAGKECDEIKAHVDKCGMLMLPKSKK